MGSKVTKHDIFHSEIYYNTTTGGPRKEPGGGGMGGEGGRSSATAGLHCRLGLAGGA